MFILLHPLLQCSYAHANIRHRSGNLKNYYPDIFNRWDSGQFRHLIGVVDLARLIGELSMLPVAFWRCCGLGSHLVHGSTREDGIRENLAPDDLGLCFATQQRLIKAGVRARLCVFSPTVSEKFQNAAKCEEELIGSFEKKVDIIAGVDPYVPARKSASKVYWALLDVYLGGKGAGSEGEADWLEPIFCNVGDLYPRMAIEVNVSCADEKHVPALVQLRNLESLTIQSPTRALLQSLPQWLGELQNALRDFRLTQMRPSINPRLTHLRHLTVRYSSVSTTDETNRLCRWVRRVIAKAPLETLRLICENETDGVAVSFHPLFEHLSLKHAARLRVLDMPGCYVSKDMLKKLCNTCTALEEVALSISKDTLDEFPLFAEPLERLHTASFNIRHHWRRRDISQDLAEALICSAPSLRRVTVDGKRYEGAWKPTPEGSVRFVVEHVWRAQRLFPWERGSVEEKEAIHIL
ncbi:hypothetical protein TRAPUB_12380 [Trametes pubescens]|uniref:Uncharacterized protein n=1 Tax=Trametes pubescens TaxID=154538 RepID=A0A1M2VU78_TRAPU|nr:hypothetical protein TRAPUB_12380 [Trametes pubescens]